MIDLPRLPLETLRLRVLPRVPEHGPAMFEAIQASMPELREWFSWARQPPSREEVQGWCDEAPGEWARGEAYAFSAFVGDDFIASAAIFVRRPGRSIDGSLGYWTRSDQAGHGYMTEVAGAVVDFGFGQAGLQRIELVAGVENTGSIRVAEKLGFRREGLLRSARVSARGRYHCFLFARLAEDAIPAAALAPGAAEPTFGADGLVTAVVQDIADGTVLMVAHMDRDAYRRTIESGRAWFWSRSRGELWEKGATSGNYMDVADLHIDCDGDAVLLRVHPHGPACHTGTRSCFDASPDRPS